MWLQLGKINVDIWIGNDACSCWAWKTECAREGGCVETISHHSSHIFCNRATFTDCSMAYFVCESPAYFACTSNTRVASWDEYLLQYFCHTWCYTRLQTSLIFCAVCSLLTRLYLQEVVCTINTTSMCRLRRILALLATPKSRTD